MGPVLPVREAPVGPVTKESAPAEPVAPVGPVTSLAAPVGPVAPKLAAEPGGPVGPVSMPTNPQGAGWAPTNTGSTKRLIFLFIHTSLCEQAYPTLPHGYHGKVEKRTPAFVHLVRDQVNDFDTK